MFKPEESKKMDPPELDGFLFKNCMRNFVDKNANLFYFNSKKNTF